MTDGHNFPITFIDKSTIVCKMGSEGFPQNLFGFGNVYTSMRCTYAHEVHAREMHVYEVYT